MVMGSIPIKGSGYFFVPCSYHAEKLHLSYFITILKIPHHSFLIYPQKPFSTTDPSSMQYTRQNEPGKYDLARISLPEHN